MLYRSLYKYIFNSRCIIILDTQIKLAHNQHMSKFYLFAELHDTLLLCISVGVFFPQISSMISALRHKLKIPYSAFVRRILMFISFETWKKTRFLHSRIEYSKKKEEDKDQDINKNDWWLMDAISGFIRADWQISSEFYDIVMLQSTWYRSNGILNR